MGFVDSATPIIVRRFESTQTRAWQTFLTSSNNGVLFHDLDFLAYHPRERFDVHNLMFYEGERLIALLPAAEVKAPGRGTFLESPYGASIGGFVLPPKQSARGMLLLVERLQRYAVESGFSGVALRVGPSAYQRQPNDLQSFALMARGFSLAHRWLLFMVPLGGPRETLIERLLTKGKRYDVRANLKKGLVPREVDGAALPAFHQLLSETYTRNQSAATHSHAELTDLFQRVPGRLRLFMCAHEGIEIAGVLVLLLNDVVANTFYICESNAHRQLCGPAVLVAHIAQQLAGEGLRYLDLGPSMSDGHCNDGVVAFKEGFGTQGFCRDAWRWEPARA